MIFCDHPVITDSLSKFFKNLDDYEVLGTFTKSIDILNFLKSTTVEIIITDLFTEEELGTDLISLLRKKAPPIVAVCNCDAIFYESVIQYEPK